MLSRQKPDNTRHSLINTSFWNRHGKPVILLAASAILLLLWSFAVPVYEAPDEPHHWHYALYLYRNQRLPIYSLELVEANSPPLYYLLIAPLAFDSTEPRPIVNSAMKSPNPPRWFDESSKDFGKYSSLRLARILTIVISVLTVLFCYLSGLEVTGNQDTGLLVGGIVAFLPQFTFRGMNVSNDSLVTMMCAVTTYLLVCLIKRGFSWKLGIMVAVTSALAFLSKTNAIFLPIPLSLAILSTPGTWKLRLGRLSVLGIIFLLLVAPWLFRNQVLYGDLLASRIMLTVVANIVDPKPITSPYFLTTFPRYLFLSFVGLFGWMNLSLPKWMYLFFGSVGLIALFGYGWRALQNKIDKRLTLLLVSFPILSVAVTIIININFSQPQGRYVFPALAAIALLMGLGLEGLPFWSRRLTYGLLGFLFVLNLYTIGTVIVPAYWQ